MQISEIDTRKWYDHITLFAKPVSLKIYLPSDQLESLRIDSGAGDISVPAALTFGSVGMKASTGDMTLKNTVVSDSFSIVRSTGDVILDHCDAGEITVQTSTGDVSGTILTEKIFIPRSSAGSIHVPDTAAGGKCQITTSTGDIRIRLK